MSGTAFGTIVLHITPESAVGGPLALVRNGDMIRLDVAKRSIELLVDEAEQKKRQAAMKPAATGEWAQRGYGWLFPVSGGHGHVRMNVGVGLWAADSTRGRSVADFYERFAATNPTLKRWMAVATPERPVGCHVGLGVGPNIVSSSGVLRIGDAANLADPLTGDGIATALRSGRLVAEAITGSADRHDAAARWQARHDQFFVPEFRRALRLQRLLTGTTSKNMTAGVLAFVPPLRARVHAALFGEMPYAGLTRMTRP